ncbi:MAG: hypothetical protein ACYTDW_21460, partial [Planctomycetota bacterium]
MNPEDLIKAQKRSGKESVKRFLILFLPSFLLIIGYVLFIDFMKFYEKPSLFLRILIVLPLPLFALGFFMIFM